MVICKYCSKEIPEDAVFCVHCGKDQRSNKLKSFPLFKIIGGIILLAIAITGTYLFRSVASKSQPQSTENSLESNDDNVKFEDQRNAFDSLVKKNKNKLLFLSFWDGMTKDEVDFAEHILVSDSLLAQDAIPSNRDTTTAWVDALCGKELYGPYFIFNFPEFKVKANILPEIDSIEGRLTSISLWLAHTYNFRYYIGEMPMKDCTVPNSYADAVVNTYSNKYGVPTTSVTTYPMVYEKEYVWNLNDKVITIFKTISKTNLDHKKKPILEHCVISYWNKETRMRINQRQKNQKQKEYQQKLKRLQKTKQSI